MSTTLQLRDAAADIISSDALLAAWAAAAFPSSPEVTVRRGFIRIGDVREEWLPAVVVAAGDETLRDDGQTWDLDLFLTCAVGQADTDPAAAEKNILDLVYHVVAAFDGDQSRRLNGLAVNASSVRAATDGGSQIPKLFRMITLKVIYER